MTITPSAQPNDESVILATMKSAMVLPGEAAPVSQPFSQNTNTVVPPAVTQATQVPPVQVKSGLPSQNVKPLVEVPSFEEPKPDAAPDGAVSDAPPAAPPADVQVADDDISDIPSEASKDNFKKVRDVLKEERKTKKQLAADLELTKAELDKYVKGETVPEILRARDERIAQLEPYEQVVSMKLSPAYQEEFVKPAIENKNKFKKLAVDYGIPEDGVETVLATAVGIENIAQRNQYLSRFFKDDIGARDARDIISSLEDIGTRSLEAEKQPVQAMQTLRQQYQEKEEKEALTRAQTFEAVAKTAWTAALAKTAAEGVFKELIIDPNNQKFNKEVVEPLQYKVSTQFGALMKALQANGLKTMPDNLAASIARTLLLGIGGAMTLNQKNAAEKTVNNLTNNIKLQSTYLRPNIGNGNGTPGQPKAQNAGPQSFEEAGKLATKNLR